MKVADEVGFRPTEPFGSLVFKTSALDRSATHPSLAVKTGAIDHSAASSHRCLVRGRPELLFPPLAIRSAQSEVKSKLVASAVACGGGSAVPLTAWHRDLISADPGYWGDPCVGLWAVHRRSRCSRAAEGSPVTGRPSRAS